ncbi:aspartyl-phosphate phosphatase Spo0E family protein [Clostridium sp. CF012]|uniref:aspartyl-phosphate phosphatase Spo0E family protein n=1 Tax=Clostridium sp. CF012 TaxID=2843319 RepID=UPI001C0E110B|nr:aspartyl-phosphate phosphatase Spo0E family protein [Clostridium sp. CF012]MBU3144741.1 aspartyl-phosphate phosphatase Spo0E family protein [Clostridium sp. CF012]
MNKRYKIMINRHKHIIKKYKSIIKNYKFMNIKLQLIRRELESLRMLLHFLLNFKNPTDKIVVSCSQQLDEVIVKYEKVKATCKKVA